MFMKTKDVLEVLKEGNYGSRKFEKAVEKAYMDFSWEVTLDKKTNMVKFRQGANREAYIPAEIVKDIIGVQNLAA